MAALACALIVALAAPAWAKKRVVVLGFDGPKSGAAQAAVTAAVKKKHTIVPAKRYVKTARRLRARKSTNKNVAKVAKELKVDAIVVGTVKRKKNRWSVTVSVREGRTGRTLDSVTVRLSSPKPDRDAKAELSANVLQLIDQADPIEEPEPPPVAKRGKGKGKGRGRPVEPEPEIDETEVGDMETETPPGMEPEPETVASVDSAPETEVSASVGDDSSTSASSGARLRDAADVSAGVSFLMRQMDFTYDPSLLEEQRPNGYSSSIPVAGAYIHGELYPFAFGGKRGVLSNIGLAFGLERSIILKSRLTVDDGMGGTEELSFDTTQQRWGIGARYRLRFGSGQTSPVLKLGLGYNRLSFEIDHGMTDIDLPDVGYEYVDLIGTFRLPFSRKLALVAEAAWMIMLSTGQISEEAYYGDGSVVGLVGDAGVDVGFSDRLHLRGGIRYQRIAYDFDGTGVDSTDRDGDPDQDVGGALDQYFGFYATLGYVF